MHSSRSTEATCSGDRELIRQSA